MPAFSRYLLISILQLTLALSQTVHAENLLSLKEAERLLLEANTDIALSRSATAGAKAGIDQAAARPNPVLSYSVNSINPGTAGRNSYWNKNIDNILRLDQPIERGSKRDIRIKAAEQGVVAAQADEADIERLGRIALAYAYVDLMAAQEKTLATRESAEMAARSLKAAELRFKAGDISGADLARIRTDIGRAQNEALAADLELNQARIALAGLLGNKVSHRQLVVAPEWPGDMQSFDSTNYRQVDDRPDVIAARQRLEQANSMKDLAYAQRSRDISIGLQYEHYPPDAGRTYGLSIAFPLLLGNDYRGDIARSEADRTAAEIQLQRTRINAAMEVARLEAEFEAQQSRYQRLKDEMLPAAEKAAQAAELAYRNGASSLTDFLDAARSLRSARQEAIQARAEAAKVWHARRLALPGRTQ